jgi:hypothetical protein
MTEGANRDQGPWDHGREGISMHRSDLVVLASFTHFMASNIHHSPYL